MQQLETIRNKHFLGALTRTKMRKSNGGVVMSVIPSVNLSVHIEQLGTHWTEFYEI
jgi:hypothetical protein